jgi:putative peptidoglycan lipid II flippase
VRLNLSLGAVAAAQLAANMVLQIVVLAVVGAGPQTDALVAAQALPQVVLAVLTVSMQSVWQPRMSIAASDSATWLDAQRAAQGQAILLFGGAFVLLAASSAWWTRLLFPGFTAEQQALMRDMSLPLLASTVFTGQSALYTTAQRARSHFLGPELTTLAVTVVSIAVVAVAVHRFGVQAAAWTLLARAIVVAVALHIAAGRARPSMSRGWRDSRIWSQLRPMLAGSSLYKTAPLVDRYWSSHAPAGGVTLLNLAQLGMGALATVLERSIATPVVPRLARHVEQHDLEGLHREVKGCVRRITVATLVVGVSVAAAWPLWTVACAKVLKLDPAMARELWLLSLLLLGYLHVVASGAVVVAAFCALGEAQTPVKIGIPAFLVSVAVKSAAFLAWGLLGLAAATSLYYVTNFFILAWLLRRRIHARPTTT